MKLLYTITQTKRFLAASIYKLTNDMVPCRLAWALEHYPELGKAVESGDAAFGTLDCWLIYKLTGGKKYVTEISNAAGTGQ